MIRKIWHQEHVVDAIGSRFALRTYLEQSDVRQWLRQINCQMTISRACDVGSGYGRLTPVLAEFAPDVVAFEREAHFVDEIQTLLPQIEVKQVENLSQLPANAASFQFILSFTVLQHLTDQEVTQVANELKRIIAAPGYILLCEATDVALRYDEDDSPEGGITIGRSIELYQRLFAPLTLVATAPRRVERTYHLSPGSYLLFAA